MDKGRYAVYDGPEEHEQKAEDNHKDVVDEKLGVLVDHTHYLVELGKSLCVLMLVETNIKSQLKTKNRLV